MEEMADFAPVLDGWIREALAGERTGGQDGSGRDDAAAPRMQED
jgi:hypothetical protein